MKLLLLLMLLLVLLVVVLLVLVLLALVLFDPPIILARISIGRGKMMVLLCSADILLRVWRYLSYNKHWVSREVSNIQIRGNLERGYLIIPHQQINVSFHFYTTANTPV